MKIRSFNDWSIKAKFRVVFLFLVVILIFSNLLLLYFGNSKGKEATLKVAYHNQQLVYKLGFLAVSSTLQADSRETLSQTINQFDANLILFKEGGSSESQDIKKLDASFEDPVRNVESAWADLKPSLTTLSNVSDSSLQKKAREVVLTKTENLDKACS